ncbi:MAG: dihydrolipoyllysine-residue succinyltransferase [candidate division Zixibacteria bacterium]|nr:dihydrolipoyllysine-residue succinyltransferase [candidate division Zixibacteria bacterium]
MPISIVVPQMGESVVEGTVGKWLKSEGDAIDKDETIAEIMTDKVNVELPAAEAGTLGKILVEEGTVVPVGAEIGIILKEGESLPEGEHPEDIPRERPEPEATEAKPKDEDSTGEKPEPKPEKKPEPKPEPQKAPAPSGTDRSKQTSPVVRRLLSEHDLNLDDIPGTGKGGRVSKQDVLKYLREREERPAAAAAQPQPSRAAAPEPVGEPSAAFGDRTVGGGEEPVDREPLKGVRKVIAEHMIASKQTSAHVMTMDEADFTELKRVRDAKKETWKQQVGANITYLPFIAKAAVAALKEFPRLNASIVNDEIVHRKYYHIGFAVGRDEGLIVPVVKFADQKSIPQIAREFAEMSGRAHQDKLELHEITGSTFTLTNAGMYGALASTPVINQPEVAILGIHKIQKRPVVRNDEIVARDMMYLTLSFDHRLVDGHTAVQFLRRLCERLEDPWELLLTV